MTGKHIILGVLSLVACTNEQQGSEVESAVKRLCGEEILEEMFEDLECVNRATADMERTADCLEGLKTCDGWAVVGCLWNFRHCDPDQCESAELNCEDSAYYHAHPSDPEGGDIHKGYAELYPYLVFYLIPNWRT